MTSGENGEDTCAPWFLMTNLDMVSKHVYSMNRSCTYCAIIVFLHFHMHAIFTRVYSIFKANTVPTKLKSMSMSRIIY